MDSNLSPRYLFPASAPPADLWSTFLQPAASESGREYTLYRLSGNAPLNQLRETANEVGVNVNGDLILLGYRILGDVVSGGKFQVLLIWQALRTLPPGTDYTFLVRVRDNQNLTWAEADGNGYRPADWQPGVQALQLLTVRLPADLPPISYNLNLEVVDRRRGLALPAVNGDPVITLDTLQARLADNPRRPALDQIPNFAGLESGAPADASGLILKGYDIEERRLRPGSDLLLSFHWLVARRPRQDYIMDFWLVDSAAQTVFRWSGIEPANAEWPTSRWPADYWVQDKQRLPVDSTLPGGHFRLQAKLRGPAGADHPAGEDQTVFDLGPIVIDAPGGE